MKNNQRNSIIWLLLGIILIIVSIGILIYTASNERCQLGPAMCSSKNWSTCIGFVLGIITISQFFVLNSRKNQTTNTYTNKNHYRLIVPGILILVVSAIMVLIGFNPSLNSSGAAVTPGAGMVILAIPTAIAGITIACVGIYYNIKYKIHPERENHPILSAIFFIGVIFMIFFLL